jgi:hypothetical protein
MAIFTILVAGMLGTYSALTRSVKIAREKTVINSLATNYLEIAKNMPYSQVGTISGNPSGQLADYTNAVSVKVEAFNYKIYYEVTYLDDPADGLAPTDPSPADYKQVKMSIQNTDTGKVTSFVTDIMPKGLEGMESGGALKILVISSVGEPVEGANIHITSPTTTPTMVLDRTSDATGQWIEVGLPPRVNDYRIVVTKTGYSTDQTYAATVSNPNPVKPDATIVIGQITQVTFIIDALSTLNIRTLDNTCQNLSGVNVNVRGAKLVGTNPDVYKFNNNYTSSAGLIALNNIEWDSYTPTLLTGQSYVVRGTSPIQKIDVLPGTTQTFTIILGTNTTVNSLLVIVKDVATQASLEGASVHLHKGGSTPQDYYGITGGSVWVQNSWTGGPGVASWSSTSTSRYYADDGNVDVNSNPTGMRLKKVSSRYVLSGWAESSTFDTGTGATNFTTLTWAPTSQDAAATLKFQIASSNNSNGPWTYLGPDGTAGTYYTVSGSSVSSAHDNSRYVRYMAYLSTTNNRKTPVLTSLNLNYVSGCYTPGQVWFPDLTAGNNYDLDVSMAGFQTQTIYGLDISDNQSIIILMSP